MKMKQTTEFSFQGEDMSYDEVEQLWKAVQSVGREAKVTIRQSTYSAYGSNTKTTYIEVEDS